MEIGRLYTVAKALSEDEKELWKREILSNVSIEAEALVQVPLEVLVLAVYACFDHNFDVTDLEIIGYGAGKVAQKYIPQICGKLKICEIWDAYSSTTEIASIPVVRPETCNKDSKCPLVIFIDNQAALYEVMSVYWSKGYQNLFYFRDYLSILDFRCVFEMVKGHVKVHAKEQIDQFVAQYEIIDNGHVPVLFSVLKKNLREKRLAGKKTPQSGQLLEDRLASLLTVKQMPDGHFKETVRAFFRSSMTNAFELACSFEKLLEELLSSHIKTTKRPMRMAEDQPYDEFAVVTVLNETLELLFDNYTEALQAMQLLRKQAETSIPLMAVECTLLTKCGQYMDALQKARKALEKAPNDLLIDEIFYQTAIACMQQGIMVEEPLPKYDLSERFCWCGLNFAWCGGFDTRTGLAEFGPCFRPLQCAARPEGEFWSGEDWEEFRRSVTDGTFRYCQKTQCPNIVAGWLPKKSGCTEEWFQRLLDGDMSKVPPLEELHFSYDGHCNLKCPSCRLEFQINTKEQNESLDELYEKNLAPYMGQAKHLTLSGCGEAMISPHSKKVLQSFSSEKNPDLVVELRTNVTTINPVSWNSLGDGRCVIRHITASIDASEKASFEKLRYPAKWETVLQNLKFIQGLRSAGEIDMFEFHVVIQTENIAQLCDIAKMAIQYSADAVTYSRLINWRGMSEEEYREVNPFWTDHPLHQKLKQELQALEILRDKIETGKCELVKGGKKVYINIHFSPDPSERYDEIRLGKLKIR